MTHLQILSDKNAEAVNGGWTLSFLNGAGGNVTGGNNSNFTTGAAIANFFVDKRKTSLI